MTTDARARLLAIAVATLGVLAPACAGGHEERRGDTVDVSTYPPDIQQAYEVFAMRCSRCHTLARPLNARIRDPQHWIRYVQRMRRMPGSGIDRTNGEQILKFLLYYHRPESQRAAPPSDPPPAPTAAGADGDASEAPAPEPPSPAPAAPEPALEPAPAPEDVGVPEPEDQGGDR